MHFPLLFSCTNASLSSGDRRQLSFPLKRQLSPLLPTFIFRADLVLCMREEKNIFFGLPKSIKASEFKMKTVAGF